MIAPALGDGEKAEAADKLEYWLGDNGAGMGSLRTHIDRHYRGCEALYLSLKEGKPAEGIELHDEKMPRFLVDIAGTEIFEGAHGKDLRVMILDAVHRKDAWKIKRLHDNADDAVWDSEAALRALDTIKNKYWVPGGRWARLFVRELGFPLRFAGISSPPAPENVEVAERRAPLGPLHDFQINLKSQLAAAISNSAEGRGGNRCILRLPTGAGKTRIAAEAIIDYWKGRPPGIRWIVWVADKEELCEQAVQCFRQLWEEMGADEAPLRIHRVWGRRYLPDPYDEGIIVAGIDKLDECSKDNTCEERGTLDRLGPGLGAVIVDEAHHALAPSYVRVLNSLGIPERRNGRTGVPLIGLTATPFRSADAETIKLRRMFNDTVLAPDVAHEPRGRFGAQWDDWHYVIGELTERGILSRPVFKTLDAGRSFEMDKYESDHLQSMGQFHQRLLDRVGMDARRNIDVFNAISFEATSGKSVLFFGTNVNQALMMSKILNDRGITSAAVTGETRNSVRSEYVNSFRSERIKVLCNYQVLTTGFDAPKTDSIVIARPTSSRVLYEQMVGRGLRGPEFGGTEECTITTVLDNILNYEHVRVPMGYEKYIRMSDIATDSDRAALDTAIREMGSP